MQHKRFMKKIFIILAILFILLGCKPQPPVVDDAPVQPEGSNERGRSLETAIVIQADNEKEGVGKEYEYLGTYACLNNGGVADLELQELYKEGESFYDFMHMRCNN